MKNCKNCTHWGEYTKEAYGTKGWGICMKITHKAESIAVLVGDTYNHVPLLYTQRDFGCALFEEDEYRECEPKEADKDS